MYVSYVGNLFLRMLKALILPLIIPSLVAAVGSLDMSISGKVGGRAVGYYMATTVMAVILGIILVSVIHPGAVAGKDDESVRLNRPVQVIKVAPGNNLQTLGLMQTLQQVSDMQPTHGMNHMNL